MKDLPDIATLEALVAQLELSEKNQAKFESEEMIRGRREARYKVQHILGETKALIHARERQK